MGGIWNAFWKAHLTDAAPADEARQREQHGHHRAAQLFPPLALGEDVDIIGRTTALAAIQRVRLPILLGQGGLYKGGGGPQQGRDPHPEDRSGTARRNRRHDAHQIAHAHAGCRGDHEGLEGREAFPILVFLADGGDHIPEQADRQQPGAQGEEHPRREQQHHHQRDPHAARDGQHEPIAPEKTVDHFDQMNQIRIPPMIFYFIIIQRFRFVNQKKQTARRPAGLFA